MTDKITTIKPESKFTREFVYTLIKKGDPIYVRIGDVVKVTKGQLKGGKAGKNWLSKCEQAKYETDVLFDKFGNVVDVVSRKEK